MVNLCLRKKCYLFQKKVHIRKLYGSKFTHFWVRFLLSAKIRKLLVCIAWVTWVIFQYSSQMTIALNTLLILRKKHWDCISYAKTRQSTHWWPQFWTFNDYWWFLRILLGAMKKYVHISLYLYIYVHMYIWEVHCSWRDYIAFLVLCLKALLVVLY